MARLKHTWSWALVLCCTSAAALEWDVEPSASIAETYTDNLLLLQSGSEIEDFVTEVTPAISLAATSKDFKFDLDYRLQGLFYSKRDDLDEVLSYASTQGSGKLIGESLLINFSGRLGQQIIDPSGRIGISSVSQTNRTEVGQFSINPYWQKQFGTAGLVNIGYQYGVVDYDANPTRNSDSSGFIATISGAPPRTPWSWRIDARDSEIEYDSGDSVDLRRVGVEIAMTLGGDTAIFFSGGDENNQFSQSLPGAPKIDGAFWSIGVRGQLDRLTTFSISAGEQHFGDSYDFSLERNAGDLTTRISYLEETTTVGRQQQDYQALFEFLTDITGVELPASGPEVYVRKRFSAKADLKLARSTWRLNAYNEDRDYLTTLAGTSDSVAGVALSWTWTAFARTKLSIESGWHGFELRQSDENPEDIRLQFRINRDLRNGLSFNARAWRNSRFGTLPNDEYEETALSIGLEKRF